MRALKIIYVFGNWPEATGHWKSALSMVKNLETMGHHVIALTAPDGVEEGIEEGVEEMKQELRGSGAECFSLPELERGLRLPITCARRIAQIAKERSVDIIHAQEFISLGRAYLAAILSGKAFVFTKAGGPFTYQQPPTRSKTVLFSQEWVDALCKTYHLTKDNLHLIPARIDTSTHKPTKVCPSFIRKYSLPESGRKIVMAMRLALGKKPWLKTILEAAETLGANNSSIWTIIAGKGPLLAELRGKAARINTESGGGPVLGFIGPIFGLNEINQLYNYADVVVGSGRGILEAMACRKPVVVMGENGEGEVVGPENIENIAYFNFSGRHFRHQTKSCDSLPVLLEKLLLDTDAQKHLGDYSYEYVKTQMDAQIGVKQLVEVYAQALSKGPDSLLDGIVWYAKRGNDLARAVIKNRLSSLRSLIQMRKMV